MPDPLQPIFDYRMTRVEAKAFKMALMWEGLSAQEFPDYNHVKLRKSGDPRKSILFKYCWKLLQETKGLIDDGDYKRYILAQLQVAKTYWVGGMIDPIILTGPKAWKRWKQWRYNYRRKMSYDSTFDTEIHASSIKVLRDLVSTRKFLFEVYKDIPEFKDVHLDHMVKWVNLSKVSPYYILLSPFIEKKLDGKDPQELFDIDLDVFKRSITDDIRGLFKIEFNHEF